MYNFAAYRPLLLLETLLQLHKWHRIIGDKPYEEWRQYIFDIANDFKHEQSHLDTANIIRKHIDAIVRNYPIKFNCMRRCMALKSMLAKRSIYCQLHIGVKIDNQSGNGKLDAHSWITLDGILVNDSIDRVGEYTEITNSNSELLQTISKIS